MKQIASLLLTLVLLSTACRFSEAAISTAIPQTETAKPTATPTVTPSKTPMPTQTPTPTVTPTQTPTPTPESVELTTPTPEFVETEPSRSGVIYFLIGHGEFSLSKPVYYGERSFSQLKSGLESLGYTLATINLSEGDRIPEEARVIVIAGPTTPLTRVEVSQLQTFVDSGGSLIVMEDPPLTYDFQSQADPLAEYLEAFWDIKLGNDAVLEQNPDEPLFTIQAELFGQHAIAEKVGNVTPIFHSARSVTPIEGTELSLVELVKSSEQTWAETDLVLLAISIDAGSLRSNQPDEGLDRPGPVTLAVVGENTNGSRVAVIGDADFVSDDYFSQSGNRNLFVNIIDWAMNAPPLPSPAETPHPLPVSGDLIAFASMDDAGWGLYLIKPDGSGLTRLEGEMEVSSEAFRSGLNLTWSPDGQMLAFQADYEGNQDIFVADLSKGSFQRIGGTERDDWYPTWSPDGQWIVFASKDRIMRIHPDGTGLGTLINAVDETTGSGALAQVTHPSWSSGGRYLVVTASGFGIGQFDIFVRDFGSPEKGTTQLFNHPKANDYYPTFAPTGFKLAFISAASMDSGYDLFFTDLQSEPVKISEHKAQFPFSFVWSPNGNKIAYSVQIGDRSEIFVVEPGVSGPIQITGEPLSGETIGYSQDGSRHPSWSPDSSRIAFQTNRDGNWEIYVMNADGSGQSNITNSSTIELSPAWQP